MSNQKITKELNELLQKTSVTQIQEFLEKQKEELLIEERPFACYMRGKFAEKNVKQQDIFLEADISERYGYKLISEEKHTQQRDVILRICYAARFTLEETQKALKIYKMPELYPRVPRDAVLMIIFNTRPGGIIEVNKFLKDNKQQVLKSCGVQE